MLFAAIKIGHHSCVTFGSNLPSQLVQCQCEKLVWQMTRHFEKKKFIDEAIWQKKMTKTKRFNWEMKNHMKKKECRPINQNREEKKNEMYEKMKKILFFIRNYSSSCSMPLPQFIRIFVCRKRNWRRARNIISNNSKWQLNQIITTVEWHHNKWMFRSEFGSAK